MGTSRVSRSERRAERKRKSDFPQLAPAPDDYPVFPDTSTWPVVFPAESISAMDFPMTENSLILPQPLLFSPHQWPL